MGAKRVICAVLASAGVAAVAPSVAGAKTYCVANPACEAAGGTHADDLQKALDTAGGSFGEDRIELGAGDFHTYSGFEYQTVSAQNSVDIVGAGQTQTFLISDADAGSLPPTLSLSGLPSSSVSDLALVGPKPFSQAPCTALDLTGNARRVAVDTARCDTGVSLGGGSTFADGSVFAKIVGATDVSSQSGASTISGSKLTSVNGQAVWVTGTSTLSVTRSRLDGIITVFNMGNGTLAIDDSSIHSEWNGIVATAEAGDPRIDVVGSTVVGTNRKNSVGLSAGAEGGGNAHIRFENSILTGFEEVADRDHVSGTSWITARYSDLDGPEVVDQPQYGTVDVTESNVSVAPGFVDAGSGDYRLRADSPLLDIGDPTPLGQTSIEDLDGGPRAVDASGVTPALPDLGAYEFEPHAPVAVVNGPSQVVVGDAVTLASASTDPDAGDSLVAHWKVDGAPAADGDSLTRSFGAAGTVSVELTVTDLGGRSATTTRTLEVQPVPPVTDPPVTDPPVVDSAPALGRVSLTHKRFAVARRASKARRARRGTTFRFTLSKDARVRIVLTRVVKGKRARKAGTLLRAGHAGANRIAFRGRVGKRWLKPGRYLAALTAIDAGGRRSATRRIKFTVLPLS